MTISARWQAEDVLVLRTDDPAALRAFLERLGLTFVEEKHGAGPTHWACERGGAVLEVYPS